MDKSQWTLPGRLLVSLAVWIAVVVSGCGFHLSRPPQLPFETLYVPTPSYASFGAELKRYLASSSYNSTRVVDRPDQAQVILQVLFEQQESQIIALSTAGRVNELLLRYRVSFRVHDRDNHEWIAPSEISVHRAMTYDDQTVLAKENEQFLLVQDMRQEAVRQAVRQLAQVRVPAKP